MWGAGTDETKLDAVFPQSLLEGFPEELRAAICLDALNRKGKLFKNVLYEDYGPANAPRQAVKSLPLPR